MTSKTHRLTTCNRHPTKPVTGVCAFCLRERLAGIEFSSTATAEPELRRTKSFSGRSGVPPSQDLETTLAKMNKPALSTMMFFKANRQAGTEKIIEQLIKLIKLTIMLFQVLLVLIEQLNKPIKYLFQQLRKVQGQRSKRKVHDQRSKFLCSICFDSKAESDMFRGGECNHPFCTDCISKHVATQIQQNILNVHCPNPNCSMELKPQHLQTLLPKEVIDRWESARYESSIAGWQKTYCPFKDCSVLLVNDGGEVVTQSECPFCHRLFCAQCKVPWHARMNCKKFQKLKNGKRDNDLDRKFLELAKGKMWQKCPKCYMYVQKRSGCEHMICRCGCHFCYQCGENWKFGHLCCRLRSK